MTLATLGSVCARGGSRHTARAGATRPESARANGDANYYFSEINAITPTTDPAAHDSVKPIRVNESRAQKAAGANERAIGSKTKRFEKGSSGPSKQPAPPPSALAAVKRPRPPQSPATTGVTDICIYRDLRSDVTVIYSSLSLSTRFVNILTKSHFS